MKTAKTLPVALVASVLLAGSAASAPDPARVHYDTVVRSALTGVYAHDGLLFVQVRTPYDDGTDTRTKSRLSSIPVATALLKQWCIDRAAERGRKGPATTAPGMALVRQIVLRQNPDWEYKDWKMAMPAREFVSDGGGFFSLCLVFSEKDIVDAIPESFTGHVSDAKWCAALRDVVPPYLDGDRSAFPFFDEIGYAEYRDATSPFTKPFSRWNAPDAANLLQSDLRAAMAVRSGSRGEDERKTLLAKTACWLEESPRVRAIFNDGKTLAVESLSTNIAERALSTVCTTNVVISVSTNSVARTKGKTSSVSLPQARTSFADAHLSWKGLIDIDFQTTPCHVVTTQETTTISRTISVACNEVVARARATPRFESLFLGAGFAANRVAPQTTLGRAAVNFVLRKGTSSEKEKKVTTALRENPGDKELWNAYGRLLQMDGDWIGSTVCFRNALSLDMRYEFALANLADSFCNLGYQNLAIGTAIVGRAFAQDPWCIALTERILQKEDWP